MLLAALVLLGAVIQSSKGVEIQDDVASPRMINGKEETSDEFTSTVFINFRQPKQQFKVCGGTLVDSSWVATSATCVEEVATSPHYLTIGIGLKRLKNIPGEHNYTVSVIEIHPKYIMPSERKKGKKFSLANNIALLKLSSPVDKSIKPAILPEASDQVSEGKIPACKAAGWGILKPIKNIMDFLNNKYDISKFLAEIDVNLLPKESCIKKQNKSLQKLHFYGKDPSMPNLICGVSEKQDICSGDNGGPLICDKKGKKVLFGLIQIGEALCRPGREPMYFTEIAAHVNWMLKTMA